MIKPEPDQAWPTCTPSLEPYHNWGFETPNYLQPKHDLLAMFKILKEKSQTIQTSEVTFEFALGKFDLALVRFQSSFINFNYHEVDHISQTTPCMRFLTSMHASWFQSMGSKD